MHTNLWTRLALVAILPLGACTAAATGDPGPAPSEGGVWMDASPDVPSPDVPSVVDAGTDAAPRTDTARTDAAPRTDTGVPAAGGGLGAGCSTAGAEPESQGNCAAGLFAHPWEVTGSPSEALVARETRRQGTSRRRGSWPPVGASPRET